MYQGLDHDNFDYITIKISKKDEFGWTAEDWREANLYEKTVCEEEEDDTSLCQDEVDTTLSQ